MHCPIRTLQRRLLRGGLVVAVSVAGLGLGGEARSEPLGQPFLGLTIGFEDDDGEVRVNEDKGTANPFPQYGDPGAVVRMRATGLRDQLTVYYRTIPGTASPNIDYYQCPPWGCGAGTAVPAPATFEQDIRLAIVDDKECEGPETYWVELFRAESNGILQPATIVQGRLQVIIEDNDENCPPELRSGWGGRLNSVVQYDHFEERPSDDRGIDRVTCEVRRTETQRFVVNRDDRRNTLYVPDSDGILGELFTLWGTWSAEVSERKVFAQTIPINPAANTKTERTGNGALSRESRAVLHVFRAGEYRITVGDGQPTIGQGTETITRGSNTETRPYDVRILMMFSGPLGKVEGVVDGPHTATIQGSITERLPPPRADSDCNAEPMFPTSTRSWSLTRRPAPTEEPGPPPVSRALWPEALGRLGT